MKKKIKVGFLYLGPVSHIYHSLSIAFHLSYHPHFDVTLFVSTKSHFDIVTHHSKIFKKNTCNIEYIPPSFLHKLLRIFKRRPHPRTRNVLQKNKDRLLDFDALVLTDRHFINGSGKQPSYIFVGHGAGDRAKGYTDAVKNFDYILLSGKEKWNRMSELISISHNNGRIIGYPKFDLVSSQDTKSRWFKNNNPVVLYNPHFNKSETSWFLWGKQILDFFLSNKQYNLIFAPHLILFSKQKNPIDPPVIKPELITFAHAFIIQKVKIGRE